MRFPRHPGLVALAAGAAVGCQEAPHDLGSRLVDGPETQSFSLLCEGTSYLRSETVTFVQTLTIDLEAGRFCTGNCPTTYRFSDRKAGVVIFQNKPSDGYSLVDKASWFPDTGQYLAEFAATYRAFYESHTVAICKPAETAIAMPAPPAVEPSRDALLGPRGPLHFIPPTSLPPGP